jgi:galactonate dehydratase
MNPTQETRSVKIIDVNAYVVLPDYGNVWGTSDEWQWTFVTIDTDEGFQGWGEASCIPRNASQLTAAGIRAVRDALVGENPADIERLWQKLYRRYTYLGSRGFPSTLVSGIDIALWDLKGKTLGKPVYDLLGGALRNEVRTYANAWFLGCKSPEQYARAAKETVASGHDALKLDPFLEMEPFHTAFVDGQISAAGEQQGYDIVAAIREAVGPQVEILVDAHGHYNVPTAVRLANRLYDEFRIGWFEEPVPPESVAALQQVRQQVRSPICVGERLFTRFDFVPIFSGRLADYVMPDVVWTGGISELKKIANMAEAHYIPISPHNAQGPGQILAGAHVSMTVPNFYRLEHAISCKPSYDLFLQVPLNWRGNCLQLSDRPGLGIDLNLDAVKAALHPGSQ